MSRAIPTVGRYKVSILDPETRKTIEVLYVNAPTRALAAIGVRLDFPAYWGMPLKLWRIRDRKTRTTA